MSAPVETPVAAPAPTEIKPTELAAPAVETVAAPETAATTEVPKEDAKVEETVPATTVSGRDTALWRMCSSFFFIIGGTQGGERRRDPRCRDGACS